jgi:hypothetical protein
MPTEESHELGRRGVIRAKHILWQVLGPSIDLPFTAYDHAPKLTFVDSESGSTNKFTFDLRGILRKTNPSRVDATEAVEVLVEVKSWQSGEGLLDQYREFLRRAAIVSSQDPHHDSWFIFVADVPFGSTYGSRLCNGELLAECKESWSKPLSSMVGNLNERVTLIITTESFRRLINRWGRDE